MRARLGLVWMLVAGLCTVPIVAGLTLPPLGPSGGRGELRAGGASTCDFGVPIDTPAEDLPPAIERDRMYMTERPGMQFKHIPILPDPANGLILAGGRYLFDTEAQAHEYFRWMREDFALDDVLFFDRPVFIDPDCHSWAAVGAHEWGALRTSQVAMRTERWIVPDGAHAALERLWPEAREEAHERGVSAVWLLHNERERLASLVYFADRVVPGNELVHPVPSLVPIALARALGDEVFDGLGWERIFDRSHWVLTTWFPFAPGDHGEASLWPSSPPLPQPTSTDGVCEVSRGEDAASAPDDCLPTCGNAREDEGETTRDCPGDVRPAWTAIP